MTARQPRFEVVHSDAGWFARFRAANGRKVWQTEVYARRSKALAAVHLIARPPLHKTVCASANVNGTFIEVRDVDERTQR